MVLAPAYVVSSVYAYRSIANLLNNTTFPKQFDNPRILKKLNIKPIDLVSRSHHSLLNNFVVAPLILAGVVYAASQTKPSLIKIENNVNIGGVNALEKISFLALGISTR